MAATKTAKTAKPKVIKSEGINGTKLFRKIELIIEVPARTTRGYAPNFVSGDGLADTIREAGYDYGQDSFGRWQITETLLTEADFEAALG